MPTANSTARAPRRRISSLGQGAGRDSTTGPRCDKTSDPDETGSRRGLFPAADPREAARGKSRDGQHGFD